MSFVLPHHVSFRVRRVHFRKGWAGSLGHGSLRNSIGRPLSGAADGGGSREAGTPEVGPGVPPSALDPTGEGLLRSKRTILGNGGDKSMETVLYNV